MKGGKLVGKGTYGCVFDQSITCDTSKHLKGVGKIFSKKSDADEEFIEVLKIKNIDPNGKFTNKVVDKCAVDSAVLKKEESDFSKCSIITEVSKDTYHQIVYEELGVDLAKYSEYSRFDSTLMAGFINILNGIKELQKKNIVHRDIKPPNLLLSRSKKMLLIDFGIMTTYSELYDASESEWALSARYYVYPPEFRVFAKLNEYDFANSIIQLIEIAFPTGSLLQPYQIILSDPKLKKDFDINETVLVDQFYEFLRTLKTHCVNGSTTEEEITIHFQQEFASKMDIFSFGISMLHIYLKCDTSHISDKVERGLITVIKKCIHFNPYKRCSAKKAIEELTPLLIQMGSKNLSKQLFIKNLIEISGRKPTKNNAKFGVSPARDSVPKSASKHLTKNKVNGAKTINDCLEKYSMKELKSFVKGKEQYKGMSKLKKHDLCEVIANDLQIRGSTFITIKRGRKKKATVP